MAVEVAYGLQGLINLGMVADKYGMEEVMETVEEKALEMLTLDTCGELLTAAAEAGLRRVEDKSKTLALEEFQAFARTDGFLRLGEKEMESILRDDGLCAEGEEAVFEAAVRWMTAPTWRNPPTRDGGYAVRGEGLLRHIRFPLMGGDYLSKRAETLLQSETLARLVEEAMHWRTTGERKARGGIGAESTATRGPGLGDRGPLPRGFGWVARLTSSEGDAWQVLQAEEQVFCVALTGRRVVCGLWSGEMQVWDLATRTRERRLVGHTRVVGAVVAWGKWVVSGSSDGQVRAWDPETGQCEAILWGHTKGVSGLAAVGMQLLSGSDDGTVRVWGLRGPPREWRWERSLEAEAAVRCVAGWEWRAVAGGADGMIRVWHATTGVLERTLMGHRKEVLALAVSGSRLLSSSEDSTLRSWSLATGECDGQIGAGRGKGATKERVRCLAAVGAHVVGGTERGRVWVWDRASLALVRSVEMAGQPAVRGLAMGAEALWGCVGDSAWAWGDPGR